MFTESFLPCVDSGEGRSVKSSFSLSPRWVLCSHPVLIKRKWEQVCYLFWMMELTSLSAVFHSLLSANGFIFPLPPCSVFLSITNKLFISQAHTQSDILYDDIQMWHKVILACKNAMYYPVNINTCITYNAWNCFIMNISLLNLMYHQLILDH